MDSVYGDVPTATSIFRYISLEMNSTTISSVVDVTAGIATNFNAIDYAVFGLLLLLSAAIGIYFGFFDGTEQTTEEYLLGGRRMRPIPVAISLVASQLSAYSIISVPAEMYSFGSHYTVVVLPVVVAMTLMVNYGILPVYYLNNIDNCYGYLELRFGRPMRSFTTVLFIFSVLLVMPIGSFLPAFAFAQSKIIRMGVSCVVRFYDPFVSGLNLHMINAIVSVVCVTYTMLGGVKAVIWTDVVQAFVMVFSIVMVLALAVVRIGGVGETVARAIDGNRLVPPLWVFDLQTRQTVWNLFGGLFCSWVAHVAFSQSCVQRLSSLASLQDAQKTMLMFCVGVVVIKATTGAIGIAMYAYYSDCDPVLAGILSRPDKLVPYFVNEIVGHIGGMPGLFISSVFSASLSTVSAYLNCISGLVYKDYICSIKSYRHTEHRANVIMKLIIVVLGVYCIAMGFLVERSSSLFQVQSTMFGLTVGVVVGIFTLALFYPWASQTATMCGAIVSMALMAWLISGAAIYSNNVYTPLSSSVDGCEQLNVTTSALLQSIPATNTIPIEDTFSIYAMSFQWYPFVGTLIVWLVGVALSHTVACNEQAVEASLLSPWVQWTLPAESVKPSHTEMRLIPTSQSNTGPDCDRRTTEVTESIYALR